MITILFIQILYIITQEYNDYYTIHSNIIHNNTTILFIQILYISTIQWLLYYSFKYYT